MMPAGTAQIAMSMMIQRSAPRAFSRLFVSSTQMTIPIRMQIAYAWIRKSSGSVTLNVSCSHAVRSKYCQAVLGLGMLRRGMCDCRLSRVELVSRWGWRPRALRASGPGRPGSL